MDRTKFYNKVTINGIQEFDFLNNPLSGFEMKYEPIKYRVSAADILRPDLVSYKNYGVCDFWWIILLVNNINNPFSDLVEGQILLIPNILDIYDFQKKFRIA